MSIMIWLMPLACMSISILRPAGGDGLEQGLPEGIAAFRNAALAMHAQGEAGDLRAFLQEDRQRIAAIGRRAGRLAGASGPR